MPSPSRTQEQVVEPLEQRYLVLNVPGALQSVDGLSELKHGLSLTGAF